MASIHVERSFVLEQPHADSGEELVSGPLSRFDDWPMLVVLGEPGIGKTTALLEAAKADADGLYASIRQFLRLSEERYRGHTLYLDGLDEQRAGTEDGAAILDKVIERLDKLDCPRVRLACRTADWHGVSDLRALEHVARDGKVAAVSLQPLDDTGIRRIIEDRHDAADLILSEVRERGLDAWLGNPQTARLLSLLQLAGALDEFILTQPENMHRLQEIFTNAPEILYAMADYWLEEMANEDFGAHLLRFFYITGNALAVPGFSQFLLDKVSREPAGERRSILFEQVAYHARHLPEDLTERPTLEDCRKVAEGQPELMKVVDRFTRPTTDHINPKLAAQLRDIEALVKVANGLEIQNAQSRIPEIRRGNDLEALQSGARQWFSGGKAHDGTGRAMEELRKAYGDDVAGALSDGFEALLWRKVVPSPAEVALFLLRSDWHPLHLPVSAGLDRIAAKELAELNNLPNSVLSGAFCLRLANGVADPHGVNRWIVENRLDLARDALVAFWRLAFRKNREQEIVYIVNSSSFAVENPVRSLWPHAALKILEEFPACHEDVLRDFLVSILNRGDRLSFAKLANRVLARDTGSLPPTNRLLWRFAALIVEPDSHEEILRNVSGFDVGAMWKAANFLTCVLAETRDRPTFHRDIAVLPSILPLLLPHLPDDPALDDAELEDKRTFIRNVRYLLSRCADDPSDACADFLAGLETDARLVEWRSDIQDIIEHQSSRRREARFRYADHAAVRATLEGGAPANVADLQALALDHLRDLAQEIRNGRDDGWKHFWNTDNERPTEPKVENLCRDLLLPRIQAKLAPHGMTAKPESHLANDRRADIEIAHGLLVLPIEVKRTNHPDLWTAAQAQLGDLYAADPGADGRGIYLVLWFGEDLAITPPPAGTPRPGTAAALKTALERVLPEETRTRISIVVIDAGKLGKR